MKAGTQPFKLSRIMAKAGRNSKGVVRVGRQLPERTRMQQVQQRIQIGSCAWQPPKKKIKRRAAS